MYEYDKQMYIVLELCDGGDLYTRSPYSEAASATIIKKLLSAVKYMVRAFGGKGSLVYFGRTPNGISLSFGHVLYPHSTFFLILLVIVAARSRHCP